MTNGVAEPKAAEDLGLINLPPDSVYVSLVPTGSISVLVKYRPDVQVSCVVPPKDFEIKFASGRAYNRHRPFATTKVQSPTLIMSCGYGDVPTPRTYQQVSLGYTLWAVDTQDKQHVSVKPYLLANVWEKGTICFGSLTPTSLRQAFNFYWSSSFNDELTKANHQKCPKAEHRFDWHNGCRCENTRNHTCECPKDTFHLHYGCGCVNVADSKKCSKTACGSGLSCLCCKAIAEQKQKAKAAGKTEKEISKLAGIEGLVANGLLANTARKYPDCGCVGRHKRSCKCSKETCACPCECKCCTKTCGHKKCYCHCCAQTCTCRCACTPNEIFEHYILQYHTDLLPSQPWKDRTAFFCGEAHWASSKGAEGVLVSNHPKLMARIPAKFWRRDKNNQPITIALANRVGEDTWKFESGPYSFSLHSKSVVIK